MSFKSPHHVYWSGSGPKLTTNGKGLNKENARGSKVSMLVDMDSHSLAFQIVPMGSNESDAKWIDVPCTSKVHK